MTSINSILIYTNIWAYLSFIFSYVLVTFIFLFCIYSFILWPIYFLNFNLKTIYI